MNRIPTIACIGEVMIEMVTKSECQAKIGVAGDTYNTAVYLKQLTKNKPITVTYVTALGEDTFSNRILDRLTSYGIDTSAVEKRTDRMPGLYAIETDENGERSFVYWRGQSAARTLFQQNMEQAFEKLSSFDLLYLSGISVAILPSSTRNALFEFLNDYRSKGGKVVFDSNYRPRLWEDLETARDVTAKMWALCDIALPSVDDEMELFGDTDEKSVIARLKNLGVLIQQPQAIVLMQVFYKHI